MTTASTWVIVPAYNEETALPFVLHEWLPVLRAAAGDVTVAVFDDGSRDGTAAVLRELARSNQDVRIYEKSNSGHGQTCLYGYRIAIQNGAQWIFQIDSDGQCDPRFFRSVWEARREAAAVFGRRVTRDDGLLRQWMSRVVAVLGWVVSGVWVPDANVPYRLMRADTLSEAVREIPSDIHLANIVVALRLERICGIHWVPIGFRERLGGSPAVRGVSFVRHGLRLCSQLLRERTAGRL